MKYIANGHVRAHDRTMTDHMFTPLKAAEHVKTSRSAIMRALASKSLNAIRDNKNRWLISQSDLEKWADQRTVEVEKPDTVQDSVRTVIADSPETIAKLAALQAENEGLRDRLADTQAERDRLATMLDKSLEARPVPVVSIWSRIFGR